MTNLFSSTVVIMTMVELKNGLREIYLYVEGEIGIVKNIRCFLGWPTGTVRRSL